MRGRIDLQSVCRFVAISGQTTATTVKLCSTQWDEISWDIDQDPSSDSICHWTIYSTAIAPFFKISNDQRGVGSTTQWLLFSVHSEGGISL